MFDLLMMERDGKRLKVNGKDASLIGECVEHMASDGLTVMEIFAALLDTLATQAVAQDTNSKDYTMHDLIPGMFDALYHKIEGTLAIENGRIVNKPQG